MPSMAVPSFGGLPPLPREGEQLWEGETHPPTLTGMGTLLLPLRRLPLG